MDPIIFLIIRLCLAVLFASAALHKLRDRQGFAEVLTSYEVTPVALNAGLVYAIVLLELLAVLLLAVNATSGAVLSLILLVTYSSLIALKLYQGKVDMDCGCSGPARRYSLSPWLLVRNGTLITANIILFGGVSERVLTYVDALPVLMSVLILSIFYLSFEQLLANMSLLRNTNYLGGQE